MAAIFKIGKYLQLTVIMYFETTRKQKISTLFISTFSLMCSIYRHMCSVFFEEIYGIYKQLKVFVPLKWSFLMSYMLKETLLNTLFPFCAVFVDF